MVNSISKEEVRLLPIARFKGKIVVIENEVDSIKAVSYLSEFGTIGFDTETRPAFVKGHSHKIALMQLSTDDTCFLFRLNAMGIPACLANLLCEPEIKKIGLSLKDDFHAIRKRIPIMPQGFIELQAFVKKYGIQDSGLQRIYAILFKEKISKNQRLTNWETPTLSEAQQGYAALDAWACLKIYKRLIAEE